MFRFVLYLFVILSLNNIAFGENTVDENEDFYVNNLNYCTKTIGEVDDYEPEKFIKDNNLLRKAGQSPVISGEVIVILGNVVDENCIPVTNASVYLWQTNEKGMYVYEPLRSLANLEFIDLIQDNNSTFTGNGIAKTDNKGNFAFITINPSRIDEIDPYLNFVVRYKDSEPIKSKFIFTDSNFKEKLPDNFQLDQTLLSSIKQKIIKNYRVRFVIGARDF